MRQVVYGTWRGMNLAHVVATLTAFVPALLLRDHAAGRVRASFHDRVRHLAANRVRHAGRHRLADAMRFADRPHFAARHADRLAHPMSGALHLFLNNGAWAVSRAACARIEHTRARHLLAASDDRTGAVFALRFAVARVDADLPLRHDGLGHIVRAGAVVEFLGPSGSASPAHSGRTARRPGDKCSTESRPGSSRQPVGTSCSTRSGSAARRPGDKCSTGSEPGSTRRPADRCSRAHTRTCCS